MACKSFYSEIVSTENQAVSFLRQHNILHEDDNTKPCTKCGDRMVEKRRKNRNGDWVPTMRCCGCQTFRSIREGNPFFHYRDATGRVNSRLTLCEILELVYFFSMDLPITIVMKLTSKSSATVVDWFNFCRQVCSQSVAVDRKGQMVGTEQQPIQIDEARFAGRRKYNRGRILSGDLPSTSTDATVTPINKRNHGPRIDGPWVFGLKKGTDCRYFSVPRRDRNTLFPIIERECAAGSVIHSDEWPAYADLNNRGYKHLSVNHQQNYVNPVTGAHTQSIERSWLESKTKILKKMRGTSLDLLQSHLDTICWRMDKKQLNEKELFIKFLKDVKDSF